ncbi:MAG: hypothetical protein HKN17_00695 [Rhodothermales bacterium]|nr:hypothetical protein [Rhodothermales bacterium]
MSDSRNRAGGPSRARTATANPEYRTPISFYVLMGSIVAGLLLLIVGLFFL